MLDQLVYRAILIFEVLHSECTRVFCFDQSTNYNSIAENALVATKINLSPRGAQHKMHNSWYIDKYGEKHIQLMIFSNDHPVVQLRRKPKGIKQVLLECNLWLMKKICLVCEKCSEKHINEKSRRFDCCVQRIMFLQPNFLEQRSLLEEAVVNANHILERYLKFYCECNFIEHYWSYVKWKTRKTCSYNYTELLKQILKVLNSVSITAIHEFAYKF